MTAIQPDSSFVITPSGSTRPHVVVPFVNTTPLTDVLLALILLPVWWALALDQFIWMLLGPYALLKACIRHRWKLTLPRTHSLLLLFIASQLVSAVFIIENERYITFARTFGAYIAAFSISMVVVQEIKRPRDIRLVLYVLLGVMGVSAVLGLLATLGVFRPLFTAPLAQLLPDALLGTTYGANLVTRHFGTVTWFSLFGDYFRLRMFFLYPTMYAAVLAWCIPIALYLFTRARGLLARAAFAALLGLFAHNLLFTTGRVAMIAVVGGFLYFLLTASRFRSLLRMVILCGGIVIITVIGIWIWQENELPQFAVQPFDDFVLARGSGSVEDRSAIYRETLANLWERPIFGWGTERDLPSLFDYPAGSHSYYLGVMYKFGIVGLGLCVAMVWSLWRETAPPRRGQQGNMFAVGLLWYGRWVMVAGLIIAFTEVLDLDTTTLVLLWMIIGLLVSTRRLVAS